MAFGKDPQQLQNIPGYGGNMHQKARSLARRDKGGGRRGGGGAPYWKGLYNPPDFGHDIVRLIPGQYTQMVTYNDQDVVEDTLPFVKFGEHHNGKRGCICSAGPLFRSKKDSLECPSCEVFWEDIRLMQEFKQAQKEQRFMKEPAKRMSRRDRYGFNVWDYGLYFEMPDTDGNGQIRVNPRTNQPYTSWVKCNNPNDPAYQGRPWKQGHLLPWAMAETYFETLMKRESEEISKACKSCGTRDAIVCLMKTCRFCGQFIYDPNNCTLSAEQQDAIDNYPYTCQHCGQTGLVSEEIQCAACSNPARATIYDVDLEIQRMGAKGKQTYLHVHCWSDPRPIQVADPNVLESIKPVDLLRKFSPTPPAKQRDIYGLGQPQVSQPGAPPMQVQQPPMAPPPQMQVQMPQASMQQPQVPAAGAQPAIAPAPAVPYAPPQGGDNQ